MPDKEYFFRSKMNAVWMILMHMFVATSHTQASESTLRSNLSTGYDKFSRPSVTTDIAMFYSIRTLQNLDIFHQMMSLTGWVSLFWLDTRLTWDNATYNINSLELDWAWRPGFYLINTVGDPAMVGSQGTDTRLRVTSTGSVRWNPMIHSETSCSVDITKYPFDTQSCSVDIIFWGLTMSEVNITSHYKKVDTVEYMENAEWEYDGSSTSVSTATVCCPRTNHPVLKITMTFIRRWQFYFMSIIIPTVLQSGSMALTFLLPTDSGERLGYSLTVTVAFTVQLTMTGQMMPTASIQVPHLARYLLSVCVMNCLVILNVILHVKLFYLEGSANGCLKLLYSPLYRIAFLGCCPDAKGPISKRNNKVSTGSITNIHVLGINQEKPGLDFEDCETTDDEKSNKVDVEVTWPMVSVLFDRLAFYFYMIMVSMLNITLIVSII